MNAKYRVFISYNHKSDKKLAGKIAKYLAKKGLYPISDKSIIPGTIDFRVPIIEYIIHSHLFLVIIPRKLDNVDWINQEIGIAIAFNIPILPIFRRNLPKGFIETAQAIKINKNKAALLNQIYNAIIAFGKIKEEETSPLYTCTPTHLERTRRMVANLEKCNKMFKGTFKIRQRGGYSSFNIPDKSVDNSVWKIREGKEKKSMDQRKLQRKERRLFDKLSLTNPTTIIINPNAYFQLGKEAQQIRLKTVKDAIQTNQKITLLFEDGSDDIKKQYTQTIVGDYFLSEAHSMSPKEGFRHTMFTNHAFYILHRIEEFEDAVKDLKKYKINSSPENARAQLDIFIKTCGNEPITGWTLPKT